MDPAPTMQPWLADGKPLPGYDFFATLGPRFLSIGTGDSISLDSVNTMSRNAQRSSSSDLSTAAHLMRSALVADGNPRGPASTLACSRTALLSEHPRISRSIMGPSSSRVRLKPLDQDDGGGANGPSSRAVSWHRDTFRGSSARAGIYIN